MKFTLQFLLSTLLIMQGFPVNSRAEQAKTGIQQGPTGVDKATISCVARTQTEACLSQAGKPGLLTPESCIKEASQSTVNIENLQACGKGVFNSVVDLIKFLGDAVLFVGQGAQSLAVGTFNYLTDGDQRASTHENVKEAIKTSGDYLRSIYGYISIEFRKAADAVTPPTLDTLSKNWAAAQSVGGSLIGKLLASAGELISGKYEEFRCFDSATRTKQLCELAGTLLVPPAAFFALLKGGSKAIAANSALKGKLDALFKRTPVPKLSDEIAEVTKVSTKIPTAEKIQEAMTKHPVFTEKISALKEDILEAVPRVSPRGITRTRAAAEVLGEGIVSPMTPAPIRDAAIGIYQKMNNPSALAEWSEQLSKEALGHMHINAAARTRAIQIKYDGSPGEYIKGLYTTKGEMLEKGMLDRQSILAVLVQRAKDSGERVGVIPMAGSFDRNTTRAWKFERFHQVPQKGPFFDNYFPRHSNHGQDIHLVQMDYIRDVVVKATNGKPEVFWNYVANDPAGAKIWDRLFDSFSSNFTSPEFIGPLLRRHLPVH